MKPILIDNDQSNTIQQWNKQYNTQGTNKIPLFDCYNQTIPLYIELKWWQFV